jgi:hypothetical protein
VPTQSPLTSVHVRKTVTLLPIHQIRLVRIYQQQPEKVSRWKATPNSREYLLGMWFLLVVRYERVA